VAAHDGGENVAYGLKLRKLDRDDHRASSTAILETTKLERWRSAIRASCPAASSSAWRWRAR
jgi:ABC-type proline/glycine betaine transport system ATPase subunit